MERQRDAAAPDQARRERTGSGSTFTKAARPTFDWSVSVREALEGRRDYVPQAIVNWDRLSCWAA